MPLEGWKPSQNYRAGLLSPPNYWANKKNIDNQDASECTVYRALVIRLCISAIGAVLNAQRFIVHCTTTVSLFRKHLQFRRQLTILRSSMSRDLLLYYAREIEICEQVHAQYEAFLFGDTVL